MEGHFKEPQSLVFGISPDVTWTMEFLEPEDSCFWQCGCDLTRHHCALSACNKCGRFKHTDIHWVLKMHHADHLTIQQAIDLENAETRELK